MTDQITKPYRWFELQFWDRKSHVSKVTANSRGASSKGNGLKGPAEVRNFRRVGVSFIRDYSQEISLSLVRI